MPGAGNTNHYTNIRWMIRRDMPVVLDIEQQSFEFPWSEEEFIRCLRQRNCIGMVAERETTVVGFMIYELHKNRLHLLNFAVAAAMRRTGVGAAMIDKLASKLSSDRRNRIMLEVRETNLDAQKFFREYGFRAISVLRSFYEDSPEDAYLMQFRHRASSEESVPSTSRMDRLAG
jgi:[ribosomal protein S18]-alanine N-acetyltransferase